ncbi:hypothetical protein MLD52_09225 [Puniceicoccaceae bacterium K14]|nr:hypothetical protein [Puniceicoccaceae bacterium K14]
MKTGKLALNTILLALRCLQENVHFRNKEDFGELLSNNEIDTLCEDLNAPVLNSSLTPNLEKMLDNCSERAKELLPYYRHHSALYLFFGQIDDLEMELAECTNETEHKHLANRVAFFRTLISLLIQTAKEVAELKRDNKAA